LAGLIGGDGDCGGQKCAKDHGGSVASVDEMRARLAVGGGERGAKQKRVRCHGRILLKLRWGSQVRRRVEERMGQREGSHVARQAEQERGTGADWWVAATVPGGCTG
jgi:hypothetical protein